MLRSRPLTLLLLAVGLSAMAQTAPPSDTVSAENAASPRRFARLSSFTGNFQVQRADNTASEDGTASAVLNMPLPEGTRLVTGSGAQAEIEFEDGSLVRLTPNSAVSLDSLAIDARSNTTTQLTLLSGLAYFELRHASAAVFWIHAGEIVATPADNSVFRVALDQPPAVVGVLGGNVAVSAETEPGTPPGFAATVKTGETLHADPQDPTRYFLDAQLAENSWDRWNQSRDDHSAAEAGNRTTARDTFAGSLGYGWSDLDNNGTWYTVPGPDGTPITLWQPTAAADDSSTDTASTADSGTTDASTDSDSFDPYGDGAFVYTAGAYYWASGYTWGWLPYRCGRWNYYPKFGWAWSPDNFCHVFGYGGGINIGHKPTHYHPPPLPPHTPVHPIIRVHGAFSPARPDPVNRQPVPVKIAGVAATPLVPLGGTAAPSSTLPAQSLYRDYPIEAHSLKPQLGTVAEPDNEPPPITGWISRESQARVAPIATAPPRIVHNAAGGVSLRPPASESASRPSPAPQPRPAPAPAPAPKPADATPAKPK